MDLTLKEVTLVNTLVAYSANDQIDTLKELSGAFLREGDLAEINSITVIDKAKQKAALDILFFSENIAVASSDNAAADVTDALMASNCLGKLTVGAADYVDLAANSVATIQNLRFLVKNQSIFKAKKKSLFILVVTRGTPTYTSTSDLTVKIGMKGMASR